ncbi:response regulator transcription factor [Pseudoclavibacter sp. RFBA6]|uniref:response regulator transcription factor n=1 Tax=Pseudoclavibacter sp. RFBA6 TaxID=2080573 RepID=UPI000CE82872|nr:response regulator transcription factor [Pseudoclavibacter sp. RFBA6]PPG42700.1 hypothetical protein C5C17_02510 [Pseudoclavibacter sp. RFBA6]
MPIEVDLVDDTPFLPGALRARAEVLQDRFHVKVHARTWLDYDLDAAMSADVVIFKAELRDHVPAGLKVRALRRLGVAAVVLLAGESEPHRLQLAGEGATAVLSRASGYATLEDELLRLEADGARAVADDIDPPLLTDRELQIACIFASRAAPSARHIGELLDLSGETIRAHLQRARGKLQRSGHAVGTRNSLRLALYDAGLLFPES